MTKPAISVNTLPAHEGGQDNAEGSSRSPSRLSSRQQDVLVGTLLGDGCLAKHGYYHRLHVKHKEAHRALVQYKYDVFRDFVSMDLHAFGQKLKGREYPCVQFATRTSPLFSEWHARFYREGRKIVPADIAHYLTSLAVAVWFMDDGAADFAGVTFQTHSFDCEGLELLQRALQKNFEVVHDLSQEQRREGAVCGCRQSETAVGGHPAPSPAGVSVQAGASQARTP